MCNMIMDYSQEMPVWDVSNLSGLNTRNQEMTKLKLISGVAVIAALGSFSLAYAGSPADYFEKVDTDTSGTISEAEFVTHKTAGGKHTAEEAQAKFAKLAGDDGELTLAELEAIMQKKHGEHKHGEHEHGDKMEKSS